MYCESFKFPYSIATKQGAQKWNYLLMTLSLVGILFSNTLSAQSTFDRFKAHKFFLEGYEKYHKRHFAHAVKLFDRTLSLNAQHSEVYRFRGEALFGMQQYEEAIRDFNQALRQNPNNAELFNRRGMAYAQLRRYDDALGDFDQALRIDPKQGAARENRQFVLKKMGQNPNQGQVGRNQGGSFSGDKLDPNYDDNSKYWQDDPFSSPSPNAPQNKKLPRSRTYLSPAVKDIPIPGLRITEVRLTTQETIITFRISSPRNRETSFRIDKPKSKYALFLSDRIFQNEYAMKAVNGITPNKTVKIPKGRSRTFSLVFERLDDSVKFFHIRQNARPNTPAWNFYDVELSDQKFKSY